VSAPILHLLLTPVTPVVDNCTTKSIFKNDALVTSASPYPYLGGISGSVRTLYNRQWGSAFRSALSMGAVWY
jgi:hypothetical protein